MGHLGVAPSPAACACLPRGAALGAGDGREGLTRHDQALHRHYVEKEMFCGFDCDILVQLETWYGKKKDE